MGTRDPEQAPLWIAASDLPVSPGHPFYTRLNALLDADGFDAFVEEACRSFYAPVLGRPSLVPGRYFRLLLVGYFEGIDSERGIAWRAADSLAVRSFLRLGLEDAAPDHSTISRTRRLIDLETHRAVFTWVQQRLVAAGLLKGRTVAIDATTLEANAAMRSIVRRDTGEDYQAYLTRLAAASGIKTPTREVLARFDRKRKKRTSNKDWRSPSDPDATVAKMKDGRTHLAHKAEHAIDLESGALVAVTLQDADEGDTTTIADTATAPPSKSRPRTRPPRPRRACTRSWRTRGTTATRRWWIWPRWACGRTSRNRTVAGAIGPTRQTPKRPSMGIAVVSGGLAGDACGGAGQNSPSDRLRTSMKPEACDARICADTRTS